MLPMIQVLVTALMLTYAGYWRRRQSKRRAATWDEMIARLRPNNDFGFDEVATRYLYGTGINATAQDIWGRIDGAKGLWAMYNNAGVLIQIAEYATEHGSGVPEELLEGLKSDAFQIRISVLMSLAQHAFSRSGVGACVNAHRASETYSNMLARLTMLFQEHSAMLFPSFLEAM
jgi:hypothetical protein